MAELGSALRTLLRFDEAVQANYDRAIALLPEIPYLPGDWLDTKMQLCNWQCRMDQVTGMLTKK